jgi:hypothetical protein
VPRILNLAKGCCKYCCVFHFFVSVFAGCLLQNHGCNYTSVVNNVNASSPTFNAGLTSRAVSKVAVGHVAHEAEAHPSELAHDAPSITPQLIATPLKLPRGLTWNPPHLHNHEECLPQLWRLPPPLASMMVRPSHDLCLLSLLASSGHVHVYSILAEI